MKPYLHPSGMGNFLDPPGYPSHSWSVWEGRRTNPHSMSSLEGALKESGYAELHPKIQQLIDDWKANRPPLESPEVQAWIAECHRHWVNCPEYENGDAIIRKFYPEYQR